YTTQEQVARGQAAYSAQCSTCHGQDIVDSIAGYPNVALFYGFIASAMPASAPGSLPPQQYADMTAYLLNQNGYPIGTEDLPPDEDILAEIDPRAIDAAGDDTASDEPAAEEPAADEPADAAADAAPAPAEPAAPAVPPS